jgi:hypothetical protein
MNPDEEIDALKRKVAEAPRDREARFRLGVALFNIGDLQGAICYLQQCKSEPRFRVEAIRIMVEALRARRMFDIAEQLASELGGDEGLGGVPTARRPRPNPPLQVKEK